MKDKFYRPLTHRGYKSQKIADNLKKGFHFVPKAILRKGMELWYITPDNIGKGKNFYHISDKYILSNSESKVIPIWGGVIALFCFLGFLYGGGGEQFYIWPTSRIIMVSLMGTWLLFSIIYYFTMPYKEDILDRINGRITFPGSFWAKNITMPFDKVIFHFSTGGENMVGAYMLQIVRPTNHTFRIYSHGSDCYESISLIVWYMDKNRPLPPGTAFDPYRDRDFERRKAEGFPPPLYPAKVATPEATKAQQKEREKYWRDIDYISVINY